MFYSKLKNNIGLIRKLKGLFFFLISAFILILVPLKTHGQGTAPILFDSTIHGSRPNIELTDVQVVEMQGIDASIRSRSGEIERREASGDITLEQANTEREELERELATLREQLAEAEATRAEELQAEYDLHFSNSFEVFGNVTFPDIDFSCSWRQFQCHMSNFSYHVVLASTAHLMRLSGGFFDFIMNHTIVKMGEYLFSDTFGAIDLAWTIIRDFINIAFIFLILYIAIKTIIYGAGNTGAQMTQIIVVALLINFSLFFTKFAIDIGNMASLGLYNTIVEDAGKKTTEAGFPADPSIANAFISQTGAASVFSTGSALESASTSPKKLDHVAIIKQSLAGSVILGVVAFVLFMAAFMLLSRFIILVFVLIASAAAMGGILLPKTKSMITDKWISALVGQTLFPAVFLLFLLVSFRIYEGVSQIGGAAASPQFADASANIRPSHLFSYVLVILMVIGSLKIAKTLSASSGGLVASKLGNLTRSGLGLAAGVGIGGLAFGGRKLIGGGASAMAERLAGSNNKIGQLTKKGLDRVANSSLDIRNSKMASGMMGAAGIKAGKGGGQGGYEKQRKERTSADMKDYDNLGKTTKKEERELIDATTQKTQAELKLKDKSASLASIQMRKEAVENDPEILKLKADLAAAGKNSPRETEVKAKLESVRESKLKPLIDEENAVSSSLMELTNNINTAAERIARIQGKSTKVDANGNEEEFTMKTAAQERQEKFVADKKSFLWGTSFSTPAGTNDFIHNVRLKAAQKAAKTKGDKSREEVMSALASELSKSSTSTEVPKPEESA